MPAARDIAKSFDHILIRNKPTIPAFTIDGVTYEIKSRIPVSALVALNAGGSYGVDGLVGYIVECLVSDEQKVLFRGLGSEIDSDGLGELIEEIVAKTTPFDGTRPTDS